MYCLNLVTSVLSCNTVYTYTAVCKYIFVFIYILSLFVYIFHILDYAPGGGQIHFQPQSFCLPAAFCAFPKRLSTRIPFDSHYLHSPEMTRGALVPQREFLSPIELG